MKWRRIPRWTRAKSDCRRSRHTDLAQTNQKATVGCKTKKRKNNQLTESNGCSGNWYRYLALEFNMMQQTTKRVRSPERLDLDCKTVGFSLKISKEIGKAWSKSLTRAKRASLTRLTGVWGESLPSLALCFQPRCRPFVWLLACTWMRNNKDCFAV